MYYTYREREGGRERERRKKDIGRQALKEFRLFEVKGTNRHSFRGPETLAEP